MALLDRIRACANAQARAFVPLRVAGHPVGLVHRERVAAMLARSDALALSEGSLMLSSGSVAERTRSVDALLETFIEEGLARRRTGERYDVAVRFGERALLIVDRTGLPVFGFRGHGVHVVGYVPGSEGPRIWVPRRALDRVIAPGRLDNTVAGGIASGEGVFGTLIRECEEEAGLPEEVVRRARPEGSIAYWHQEGHSVRNDRLFVYDLPVPEDVVPVNRDGEVEKFRLMPWPEVLDLLVSTPAFKFNSAVVLVDFLLRHRLIDGGDEPGLGEEIERLRYPQGEAPGADQGPS